MKNVSPILLLVVLFAFFPAVLAQQVSEQKSKPTKEDSTTQLSSSTTRTSPPAIAPATTGVPAKPSLPEPLPTEIYRVGAGDVLDIHFLNSTAGRSTLFTVLPGGLIDLPIAGGSVAVGGLTVEEIQTRIGDELKRRAVDDGTQVSVGIRQYTSHALVVTGLVGNPGTRFLRREAVPLYVIMAESQLRNDAGRVVIMRAGATAHILDLSDPSSLNVNVTTGDVISVSARPQQFYYIAGRINYPGQKSYQPGITLLQAILAAGGTTRQNDNSIQISREGAEGRLVTTRFSIREIKAGQAEDPKLQPGDRIEVAH